jgi:hypothetical protein
MQEVTSMPFEHDYGDFTRDRKSDIPPHVVATSERDVDADMLRESLEYYPDTGKLFWKKRPRSHFKEKKSFTWFNNYCVGKPAFATMSSSGYLCGGFSKKMIRAHRVAWLCFYGEWPKGEIDHVNRDRSDNRIVNLRVVTRQQNARNKKRPGGIQRIKSSGRWRVQISIAGKPKHIGNFKCFGAAMKARRNAEFSLGWKE